MLTYVSRITPTRITQNPDANPELNYSLDWSLLYFAQLAEFPIGMTAAVFYQKCHSSYTAQQFGKNRQLTATVCTNFTMLEAKIRVDKH